MTSKYNEDMQYWLSTPELAFPPIELVEIERTQYEGTAISASWVRRLLAKKQMDVISHLVPDCTYNYLISNPNIRQKSASLPSEESVITVGEL
ncbi:[citrate (pro-3S)-lyase] ligase [Budvicia aquatica]|uniref:[citrate (Pro-3S)-lyase] ligase n=1 Tax=Budvicia aquatica TaxID=82979 RepID=A0A484ZCG7_9GAMM|nr:[citrate (pro-3S)-lyase] ligase [Budvicia aquatica]